MGERLLTELYGMQKAIWRRNKQLINHSILVKEPAFARYEARYKKCVAGFERISTQEEMLSSVLTSDIIYVGDYHTCNQSQRSFLRILKATIKKTKKFAICMELIHASHQRMLDDYMAGKIKDETFLKKIGFEQHWIFDLWMNFKPIFDFAKYHKIKVYAVDAAPIDSSLKERDQATGELIAKIHTEDPRRSLFVLIGDLHLAPEHLPAEVVSSHVLSPSLCKGGPGRVDNCFYPTQPPLTKGRSINTLTLFQNSDNIYWALAEKGLEDQVEVVKINDGAYCRMHTPPVICQQSYINWLEHEEGEVDFSDAKQSFLELVKRISAFLDIRLGKKKDDVEVYTCGDLGFLKKIKKDVTVRDYRRIKRQILLSESYYLANEKIVYLGNLSINHAAEEASHFVKNLCSGSEFPRLPMDAFFANILHEAIGFFGSKLINSKRKCLHEAGFRNLVAYFDSIKIPRDRRLEYETATMVTTFLKLERKGQLMNFVTDIKPASDLFMAVTHAIGYMLGDKMYFALKADVIDRLSIRYLFYDKWEGDSSPVRAFIALSDKVRHVKVPKRM